MCGERGLGELPLRFTSGLSLVPLEQPLVSHDCHHPREQIPREVLEKASAQLFFSSLFGQASSGR